MSRPPIAQTKSHHPFVGRERELSLCHEALERAAAGDGSVDEGCSVGTVCQGVDFSDFSDETLASCYNVCGTSADSFDCEGNLPIAYCVVDCLSAAEVGTPGEIVIGGGEIVEEIP